MARIAWFSPMPPVRSGIAAVSADVVPALSREHAIDVYVDEPVARLGGGVRSAHDFIWANRRVPYDLTVYQVGNSSSHDYLLPYLFRFPGLAVLHDVRLHHARAAALLRRGRATNYREEFAASHPRLSPDLAELAVAGFDNQLYYAWPMTRLIALASRGVAVHTTAAQLELNDSVPAAHVERIRLGHGVMLAEEMQREARARVRVRLGIPGDAVVFGCFGGLTPEKRLPQILAAFAATLRYAPAARLLLVGAAADHYDLASGITRHGIAQESIMTGYVASTDELTELIAACDVGLSLRWPTAGEVSGPWLRCLALGKATIILDLAHLTEVPSLDPRTWQRRGAASDGAPATVAVDVLDEDHSLRLAMRRLVHDADLRRRLGHAALEHWQRQHTVESMIDDYRDVVARACERPTRRSPLPAPLTDDGTALLRSTLDHLGVGPRVHDSTVWTLGFGL